LFVFALLPSILSELTAIFAGNGRKRKPKLINRMEKACLMMNSMDNQLGYTDLFTPAQNIVTIASNAHYLQIINIFLSYRPTSTNHAIHNH